MTDICCISSGTQLPTKNKLFPLCTEILRRPSQNSLSAVSFFPDFCSIDRSPVLTHRLLLLITAGGTKGADFGSKKAKINLFVFAFLLPKQMLRICPQNKYNYSGGALVPLRSGLVQTGCQKSGKNDSRHLRQLLGRRSVHKGNNNFSGSGARTRYSRISVSSKTTN